MGQSIMESRTQNARKFHIAMKTVEKYIRMTHVNVEVVRNSKNVVDVIVQDKNHKLCADSRLYAIFPICYTVISDWINPDYFVIFPPASHSLSSRK